MKRKPSETKVYIWKFNPITHSIIYHYQKSKKSSFALQKSLRFLKFLRVFIDRVVLTFHSDRILFRFLFDSIFFRALSDRGFFESLVIGSSSGSAVTDSSLGSSVHFFCHDANFLSNRATTLFYQKQMFCFTFHYQNEFRI